MSLRTMLLLYPAGGLRQAQFQIRSEDVSLVGWTRDPLYLFHARDPATRESISQVDPIIEHGYRSHQEDPAGERQNLPCRNCFSVQKYA